MKLPKLRHILEEARLLGPKKLAFRVGYEVANRSGLRRWLESTNAAAPPAVPDFDRWWAGLDDDHWFVELAEDVQSGRARAAMEQMLADQAQAELVERAEAALGGNIRCFSCWQADFGDPVDWHVNPRTGARWPLEHWSTVLGHGDTCGDVKFTWEINRFPHLYDWVRAYVLTGDTRWVRAFAEQLADWEKANPYRMGVNWSSGQELAIRLMAWSFAVAVMGHDAAFGAADFDRFARLVYRHAEHIDHNIDYARLAVHNNHLIGEALGLWLVGSLFPTFDGARGWRHKARALLTTDCVDQFWSDGGYCQSSHTYHRLALQYYVWASRLGAVELADGGEAGEDAAVRQLMARSADYLAHFLNQADGRLPNFGANDGTHLNPWTPCNYGDFRPLLTAIEYLLDGRRAFRDGPWDECLLWLFGASAIDAPVQTNQTSSKSFETAGLHVLRHSGDRFAVMRCGSVIDRFGQADQLHVDLWHDGHNIAVDPGSYCYNDELAYHRWMMGTAAHNTVTVDGRDQMLLHRRFKWLYWTDADCPGVAGQSVQGCHHGYHELGVTHRRLLSQTDGGWRVVDWLDSADDQRHVVRLHWLLADGQWSTDVDEPSGRWTITLALPEMRVKVTIAVEDANTGLAMTRRAVFFVERAQKAGPIEGWQSRYYGRRQPAVCVRCDMASRRSLRMTTEFDFIDGT